MMKKLSPLFLLVAIVGFAGTAVAQKPPKAKKELWQVVEKDTNLEVIKKADLKTWKKAIETDHKEAVAAWTAAKKQAKKDKQKFKDPKPKKPKTKVYPKTFKSEPEARKYLEDIEKKRKKKKSR